MNDPINLHLRLMIEGFEVEAAVTVPQRPAPRRTLLPILQNLTDTVIALALQNSAAPVSCTKGCDACCRQMVPISSTEAYALAALLDALAPAAASAIQERFDQACEALDHKGLLLGLTNRERLSAGELGQLDRDYFAAGVPCPFLENHACSIHRVRPLACREFLVTSPGVHCSNPTAENVRQLPLGAKVSVALANHGDHPWLPLVLARRFVAAHPEKIPPMPPRQLLQQILESL